MSKISVILLAGGVGKRLGQDIPKQHLLLHGKPIIIHSIEKLDNIDRVDEIIITCPLNFIDQTKKIVNSYNISKTINFISGGDTRQESVYKGLLAVKHKKVLIHEAARPFLSTKEFLSIIDSKYENVTYAIDIPFTVLEGRETITGILNRNELLNIQLPQKFNKEKLLQCHENARKMGHEFTEDTGMLYFYLQEKIHVLKGNEFNLKITTPLDLIIGEKIYKEKFM